MRSSLLTQDALTQINAIRQPTDFKAGNLYVKYTRYGLKVVRIVQIGEGIHQVKAYTIKLNKGQIVSITPDTGLTQIKQNTLMQGWLWMVGAARKFVIAAIDNITTATPTGSFQQPIAQVPVNGQQTILPIRGYKNRAFVGLGIAADSSFINPVQIHDRPGAISMIMTDDGLNVFVVPQSEIANGEIVSKNGYVKTYAFTGKLVLTTDGPVVHFGLFGKRRNTSVELVAQGQQTQETLTELLNNGFIAQLYSTLTGSRKLVAIGLEQVKVYGLYPLFSRIIDRVNIDVSATTRLTLMVDTKDQSKVAIGLSDGHTSQILFGTATRFGFVVDAFKDGLFANEVNTGKRFNDRTLVLEAMRMFAMVKHTYGKTGCYGQVAPVVVPNLLRAILKQVDKVSASKSSKRRKGAKKDGTRRSDKASSEPIDTLPTELENREFVGAGAPTGHGFGAPDFAAE